MGIGILDEQLFGQGQLNAVEHHPLTYVTYVGLFLYYWANYFVIIFFNSALVGCAP